TPTYPRYKEGIKRGVTFGMSWFSSSPIARFTRTYLFYTALLLPVIALICSGCGRTEESNTSNGTGPADNTNKVSGNTSTGPSGGAFKVALVMSGPKSDNGWNAGAAKALDAVKTQLNLSDEDVKSVDNQTSAGDQEKSLRDFAAKKFNLVF